MAYLLRPLRRGCFQLNGGRRLLLMEAVGIDDLTTLLQYLATNRVRENIDSVR